MKKLSEFQIEVLKLVGSGASITKDADMAYAFKRACYRFRLSTRYIDLPLDKGYDLKSMKGNKEYVSGLIARYQKASRVYARLERIAFDEAMKVRGVEA
tara:strand:+ start:515 stop:811 length:297 start_codon:yes stop_codon:yes gene_type:complete